MLSLIRLTTSASSLPDEVLLSIVNGSFPAMVDLHKRAVLGVASFLLMGGNQFGRS